MIMTSRQRMLTAMTRGIPDRVPASPDTNWMIPARLTGKPFWEVYLNGDPPIWKAYNDCVRHYGIDGFSHHGYVTLPGNPNVQGSRKIIHKSDERVVVRSTMNCPAGKLTGETTYLRYEAPTQTEKRFKTFDRSTLEFLPYLFPDPSRATLERYKMVQKDMGDAGVVGLCIDLPTLWTQRREPAEAAMFDYYDSRDVLDEAIAYETDWLVRLAKRLCELEDRPDFVFFPNSGMITMQSLEIMKRYSIPALRKLTKIFKEADIVTSLHCCGKERALVEIAANETDLDCIDPLEIPPMGDCDLEEIKKRFGNKLALKGNLHTTEVMLRMDADTVEMEARKVLDIAMAGGGFILATGDQCGRDTPDANITRLVEVCEQYGRY
jgi:uroporphyrinogen decarboxylase